MKRYHFWWGVAMWILFPKYAARKIEQNRNRLEAERMKDAAYHDAHMDDAEEWEEFGSVVKPQVKKGETQVCDVCGRQYVSANSHEEAMKEAQRDYPEEMAAGEEYAVVCDPCYQQYIKWSNEYK